MRERERETELIHLLRRVADKDTRNTRAQQSTTIQIFVPKSRETGPQKNIEKRACARLNTPRPKGDKTMSPCPQVTHGTQKTCITHIHMPCQGTVTQTPHIYQTGPTHSRVERETLFKATLTRTHHNHPLTPSVRRHPNPHAEQKPMKRV